MRTEPALLTLDVLSPPHEAARPVVGRRVWIARAGIPASLFAFVLVLQYAGGAFANEYGGFPDEAAHFVTGLMVHDYVLSGTWSDPMTFARAFYAHYPKIGLGHWPPVFYVALALWMVIFGTSHVAVMLFITTTLSGAAWLLYRMLCLVCDPLLALSATLVYLALPLVLQYGAMVMMESAMTLLMLSGVWLYARYLDEPSRRRGLLFGVVASVAILTKGTAIALGAIPPLAVMLTRRFKLLRRGSFWLPAVVVAVMCGPWYVLTLALQQNGMTQAEPSLAFTLQAFGCYVRHLVDLAGVAVSAAAMAGVLLLMTGEPEKDTRHRHLYVVTGACLIGIVVLQSVVPVMPDPRHLIPAAPLVILFAVKGIRGVAVLFGRFGKGARVNVLLVGAAVAILFAIGTFKLPQKYCRGFIPVVETVMARPAWNDATILVSSNSAGEGMAIAEVARRERRPGRIVKRASQTLSRSRWDGSDYQAEATTPPAVMDVLRKHGVTLVLLDDTTPDYPQYRHHGCLVETIRAYPERFQLLSTWPLTGQNPTRDGYIHLYRVMTDEARGADESSPG